MIQEKVNELIETKQLNLKVDIRKSFYDVKNHGKIPFQYRKVTILIHI